MKNKILASLSVVLLAGGALVATASASSAAPVSACTSYKSYGAGSSLRFVPVNGSSTTCYLKRGHVNNGVWALQQAVKVCNYRYNLVVDKSFGGITESAVIQFQNKKGGLEVDGVYGPKTRNKMSFYGGYSGATSAICNKA